MFYICYQEGCICIEVVDFCFFGKCLYDVYIWVGGVVIVQYWCGFCQYSCLYEVLYYLFCSGELKEVFFGMYVIVKSQVFQVFQQYVVVVMGNCFGDICGV